MNFSFSEEQAGFKASVERFMADHYTLEKRREYLAQCGGYSAQNWQVLAELGLLALPLPEDAGGLGGSSVDVMAVMEAFAVGPLVEPYLPSVLLAGDLLARHGNDAQQDEWIGKLISGDATLSLAYVEKGGRFNLARQSMSAQTTDAGYLLNGTKTFVMGDSAVDAVIVSARTSGAIADETGISLFLLPMDTKGVTVQDYRLVDGSPAMALTFEDVLINRHALIGEAGAGFTALEDTLARASLALCSEMTGIIDQLMSETLDYLKTRTQFGRSLGSFQALQHRMAEHFVNQEQCQSLVIRAVATSETDRKAWLREIYGAKAFVSEVAMKIGQDAIQLHGGMGTTDELIISHYHKRLLLIQNFFGDAVYNYRRHQALAT